MREEGPGGSTGLAGWLSCHVGIGWGWDPCEDPCKELCLSPQPWHCQGTPRAMGWQGQPEPLGLSHERDGVQKHQGMWG